MQQEAQKLPASQPSVLEIEPILGKRNISDKKSNDSMFSKLNYAASYKRQRRD